MFLWLARHCNRLLFQLSDYYLPRMHSNQAGLLQRGGDEAEIDMRVARVRKIRHLIYPPSAELHAVSGAVRNEDTEALRRKLRAAEYPEPVRPRL